MSKLSNLRADLMTEYQVKRLNAILEHRHPKLMKGIGILWVIFMMPFYMFLWVFVAAIWVVDKIDTVIEYLGEFTEDLMNLFYVLTIIALYKIILRGSNKT